MRKINKVGIIIGVTVILAVGAVWLVRFSYQKPQTVWQDILSRAGYGKPTPDAASKIVFLGDSITFREDWNVLLGVSDIVNAGVSGNTTDDVLARLDGVISSKPQKLFLMIGINDLLRGKEVAYVFANYEKIISQIKTASPHTTIYLQSVLPMNNELATAGKVDSQKIIDLNAQLKVLARKNKILFINLYPYFCGSDQKLYVDYAEDGLHPNSHGYAVWKKLIADYVQ